MLNENIKTIRKSRGLTQQELADELHVVRQTVSKWERGLSAPDSEMLISISEALEVPVSALLGETVPGPDYDDRKKIAENTEILDLPPDLKWRKNLIRRMFHWLFILLWAAIVIIFVGLAIWNSPYLGWDYSDPETAVVGVLFHAFEWLFVRMVPLVLIVAVVGFILTRKQHLSIRFGSIMHKSRKQK